MAWMRVKSLEETLRHVMKSSDAWMRLSIILADELGKHDPAASERLFGLHRDRAAIVDELHERFGRNDGKAERD